MGLFSGSIRLPFVVSSNIGDTFVFSKESEASILVPSSGLGFCVRGRCTQDTHLPLCFPVSLHDFLGVFFHVFRFWLVGFLVFLADDGYFFFQPVGCTSATDIVTFLFNVMTVGVFPLQRSAQRADAQHCIATVTPFAIDMWTDKLDRCPHTK